MLPRSLTPVVALSVSVVAMSARCASSGEAANGASGVTSTERPPAGSTTTLELSGCRTVQVRASAGGVGEGAPEGGEPAFSPSKLAFILTVGTAGPHPLVAAKSVAKATAPIDPNRAFTDDDGFMFTCGPRALQVNTSAHPAVMRSQQPQK